ncbi:MAG: hypothetical protein WAN74_07860 [Thermoplasmata archaeon]
MKDKGSPRKRGRMISNWDLGAVVVAIIASVAWLITMLSKPSFVVIGHTVVVTQGIMAGVILFGAAVWAAIEVFTPPGETVGGLILRSAAGFLVGGLFGGFAAYVFNWGSYLINPAIGGGNGAAIFELAGVLFLGFVLIWDAAWSHSRRFVRA